MKLSEIEVGKTYLAQQLNVSVYTRPWRMKVKVLEVGCERAAERKVGRYHTQRVIKHDGIKVRVVKTALKKLADNVGPTWPNEGNHPERDIWILRPQEIHLEWTKAWEEAQVQADEDAKRYAREQQQKREADEAAASKLLGRARKLHINPHVSYTHSVPEIHFSLEQFGKLLDLAEMGGDLH